MPDNDRPVSPVNGVKTPRGKPFTSETASEAARKRHQRDADRKSIARAFIARMGDTFTTKDGKQMSGAEIIADSIIRGATHGNSKMVEIALGLLGEKPAETVNVNMPNPDTIAAVEAALFGDDDP